MALGDILRSFAAPGTEGRGLAWDGRTLWHSDSAADLIYQIDPSDGTVIRSVATPSGLSFGLTWDGRTLWLADLTSDLIYQIAVN